MKTLLLTLLTFLTTATLWAQAPQRMSYQSVIRDGSNVLVAATAVGIKISVLRGNASGTAVYVETHRKTTNANGLLSLEIGEGTALLGTFAGIDWANGPYVIKSETDPRGGTNYSIPGVTPLNSVPYALFSANGTPGPQGSIGLTGPAGPAGPTGPTGATGPAGPIGLTGPTGATGPAGANGTNGIDGVAGPQGPIGLTGPAGAAGIGGVTTAGTNITLSGSGTVASPYVVSANIPAAAAGTLTGSSLNASVTGSSLTSVGTLANLTVTNPIVGSITGSSSSTTGNAATATKLAASKNINGVAFDGSADITVTAAAGTLTGATLNSTVTGSSLTSVGRLVSLDVNGAATNTTAFNAAASTTIDFTKSNLAYTSNNPSSFTLSGIKDGGTYTLAVQGTTSGTSAFSSGGFTFMSVNNGPTTSGKQTLYTFIVMGTTVYFFMTTGF